MLLNYIDESGVPEKAGTSHFVLLALGVPATSWRVHDDAVALIKAKYGLGTTEIHTGWIARRYLEQERIPGFAALEHAERRKQAVLQRQAILLHAVATKTPNRVRELQKNFRKTAAYLHLTLDERWSLLRDLADLVGTWGDCYLFCNAVDKGSFGGGVPVLEHAFTNVTMRIQHFLTTLGENELGILISDDDESKSARLTELMREFYKRGAGFRWRRKIDRIVETPLFVDSTLTGMVQLADLCAYAVRRFFENGETDLLDRIYSRFPRVGNRVVTFRHSTGTRKCVCRICVDHGRRYTVTSVVTVTTTVVETGPVE